MISVAIRENDAMECITEIELTNITEAREFHSGTTLRITLVIVPHRKAEEALDRSEEAFQHFLVRSDRLSLSVNSRWMSREEWRGSKWIRCVVFFTR
jgi:hypothetical protein